jgi:hypothetical protein
MPRAIRISANKIIFILHSLADIEVSIQVSRGVLFIIHSPAETEAPTQVSRNVLSILKDLVGVLNRKYNYEAFLRK